MFEDTLLIIKADYLHKRKPVLLKLLQTGFQIQGSRKVQFSPELAAEFYKDLVDDKNFMLLVILLSKGPAEAFILTKENAVVELVNTMVCYFSTSQEMDRNVHVTKFQQDVRREITFIFPNYIHEPIPYFQGPKFSSSPLLVPMINELYEIVKVGQDENKHWRLKLAEWLQLTNKTLPHVTNQCSYKPCINYEEKGQQVNLVPPMRMPCAEEFSKLAAPGSGRPSSEHSASLSKTSAGSSMLVTSTSCITCTCFDGTETCMHPPPSQPEEKDSCVELFRPKTAQLQHDVSEQEVEEEEHVCEHGYPIYGPDVGADWPDMPTDDIIPTRPIDDEPVTDVEQYELVGVEVPSGGEEQVMESEGVDMRTEPETPPPSPVAEEAKSDAAPAPHKQPPMEFVPRASAPRSADHMPPAEVPPPEDEFEETTDTAPAEAAAPDEAAAKATEAAPAAVEAPPAAEEPPPAAEEPSPAVEEPPPAAAEAAPTAEEPPPAAEAAPE